MVATVSTMELRYVDVYARISLDTEGTGESVDNQLSLLGKYASEHGLEIVDTFRDDGISATSGKARPGFEAVLARGKGARPLLTFNTDRFVRVSRDLERVLDLGLEVLSVTSSNLDLSTAGGRAVARTLVAWNTYEGDIRKERLTLAYSERASRGVPIWKQAPFGYTREGKTVAEQSDLIRDAADRVINGESLYSLAKEWTANEVPTRHGAGWSTQSLRDLLLHPRMTGQLTYKGEVMPESKVEATLTKEQDAALRAVLLNPARRKSKGGHVTTLLSGIAHCGICNVKRLHASTYRGRPAYRCQSDNHNSQDRKMIDVVVINDTVRLLISEDAPSLLSGDQGSVEALARLEEIRRSLDEWESMATEMGPAEYLRITKPLRTEADALTSQLAQTNRAELFSDFIGGDGIAERVFNDISAIATFRALPLLRQRAIVDELWTITVTREAVDMVRK